MVLLAKRIILDTSTIERIVKRKYCNLETNKIQQKSLNFGYKLD